MFVKHQLRRGAPLLLTWRKPRNCADARYLANLWAERSRESRAKTAAFLGQIRQRTLHDYVVTPGASAWKRAVREAQRPYPGTESWLLSCSSSEGGWGRWVRYGGGDYYEGYSGVGGWLQFMPGTFYGFVEHAIEEVENRGFIVPKTATAWTSALGQALAGAWGITHNMGHHWAGAGCR